jgi:CelD/BcsL family acetyltransferase involved in cellulose biosynthesis
VPGTRIERIDDPERLAALAEDWSALWERCPVATPFQAPEWLLPWWRHLGRGRLRSFAAWEGERLVALAPGFTRRYFGTPVVRWSLLGTGQTDYLDLLVEPGRESVAQAVLDALVGSLRGHEFADLQQLPPESPLAELDVPASHLRISQEVCPRIALPFQLERLLESLPARMRENLRYYRRRLAQAGRPRFEVATEATLEELLAAVIRLHQARWRRRGLPGGFVAAAVCRGRMLYYLGGFDPAHAALSPGTLLTAHAMEDAIRHGAAEFDFLRGGERYKYAWGAVDHTNSRLLVWRRRFPAALAPRLNAAERAIEQCVKARLRR